MRHLQIPWWLPLILQIALALVLAGTIAAMALGAGIFVGGWR